jgi:hypothetical protein
VVCAVTSHSTRDEAASSVNSTLTLVSAIGWHSGIRSDVRLEAWMPAMRAMPSTSPFFAVPLRTSAKVSGSMLIDPAARAMRAVCALPPTSTMCAWPSASKWVSGVPSGPSGISRKCRLRSSRAAYRVIADGCGGGMFSSSQ